MPETKTNREWTDALEYTKDRDGNPCPVNNVGNLVTILENDERLRGKIRYNEFSSIIEHDELPWNGKGEWVDDDNAELRFLLEDFRRSGFQKDKVMDALAIVAKKHRYHPIREYLGTGKSAFGKALVGNKWFNDSDIDVGFLS